MSKIEKEEYRILNLPLEDLQKILNQWKHEYKLFIIAFGKEGVSEGKDIFYALIKRVRLK